MGAAVDDVARPSMSARLGVAAAVVGLASFAVSVLAPASLVAAGPLRAGAAAGIAIGGLALVALGRPADRRARRLSAAAAVSAAALGAASLGEEVLFGAGGPSLMSRSIALGLVVVGAGIACAGSRRGRVARLGERLAGVGAALAATFLLGHLYAADGLRSLGGAASSPWTALGVLLLGLGGLVARPGFLLSRVLAGRSLGAVHLRRALPALLGVPLAVGIGTSWAARSGLLTEAAAFAVFTLVSTLALGAFATRHARRIDQLARERVRLEGLFRRTFENAAVGIAHVDADGRWLRVNDRLCEIVGRPRDELRALSMRDAIHPDEREADLAVREALAGGGIDSHRCERRFVTKEGHEAWVDLVLSAERDPSGRVEHLVAVLQDISERKRAEAELGLVRRALECSGDGVLIVSTRRPEGEIVFVNPAFERITGYAAGEALGRGFELLGELASERSPLEELCARARRDDGLSLLLRGRRKDGAPYWGQLRLAPVVDPRTGSVTHHVGVLEDVTQRLGAVAERERLLGEAVSAREEAERANRAKDEFLALVSHELRSPLGVVASWLPMLRSDARPELRERAAGVIERNVALLSRVIGDLLDASRIVSGKLEIERGLFELAELVRTAVGSLEPTARERGVSLRFRAEPAEIYVLGDAERIDQVVHNLVDNAIKFTPAEGRVEVALRQREGRVELAVSDDGQGIAPELLPTVFSRFRQGGGGPRGTGRGLGLGLAIVRHVAELHGGRVEAESDGPGRGTRIRVELPAALEPSVRVPRPAGAEGATLEGLCVLLLEPDRSAAEALALALEAADADVAWVRSAAEALAQGGALEPEVLVAAFDAVPEEAADLLAGLRSSARGGRPPVAVALSTERTPEARRRAREAGFDAWLTRPFDPARLVEAIRGLWRRDVTHVLVIDDDRDAADALALLLERRGFEVQCAYGAAEALELAARFEPGAVVTDLRLGDGDGAELGRVLRARDPSVRIIAVTGSAREDLGADAALFDGVVRKPVALPALLELLGAA